jgi:hypothetical protein
MPPHSPASRTKEQTPLKNAEKMISVLHFQRFVIAKNNGGIPSNQKVLISNFDGIMLKNMSDDPSLPDVVHRFVLVRLKSPILQQF